MTHHSQPAAASHLPPRAPAWFRYGVIAAAAIIMCSCRGTDATYRVAGSSSGASTASLTPTAKTTVRLQSPAPAAPPKFANVPTHVTPAQYARSTCLPEGNYAALGGCSCCNDGSCRDYGPIRGPNDEYLCDGGDYGLPVGVTANWEVRGLEPEDTIAHYDTIDGRTVVTPSNKVCIYAPRFAAVRQVVDPQAYARIDALEGAIQNIAPVKIDENEQATTSLAQIEPTIHRAKAPPSLLRERLQPDELARDRRVEIAIGSLAPYCNIQVIRTGEITGVDIVKIARSSLAAITWSGDQAAQVLLDSRQAHAEVSVQTPGTIYQLFEPNNPKLRLLKLASTGAALPGEEVEFTLRFDNVGDRVIGNVTIVDHLTTRLEYVPDSQKSTVKSDFKTEGNVGESLTLRWEITDPIQPGEGGVLRFKTRVR